MIMFVIILWGFAQAHTMVFGLHIRNYRTIGESMYTLLRSLLGDFDFESMQVTHSVMGPAFFIIFVVLSVFVLLNILIAIISDSYAESMDEFNSLEDHEKMSLGSELMSYLRSRLQCCRPLCPKSCCKRTGTDALPGPPTSAPPDISAVVAAAFLSAPPPPKQKSDANSSDASSAGSASAKAATGALRPATAGQMFHQPTSRVGQVVSYEGPMSSGGSEEAAKAAAAARTAPASPAGPGDGGDGEWDDMTAAKRANQEQHIGMFADTLSSMPQALAPLQPLPRGNGLSGAPAGAFDIPAVAAGQAGVVGGGFGSGPNGLASPSSPSSPGQGGGGAAAAAAAAGGLQVGDRVSVRWGGNKWFQGVVKAFDSAAGEHEVQYDDGDLRRHAMAKKRFKVLARADAGGGGGGWGAGAGGGASIGGGGARPWAAGSAAGGASTTVSIQTAADAVQVLMGLAGRAGDPTANIAAMQATLETLVASWGQQVCMEVVQQGCVQAAQGSQQQALFAMQQLQTGLMRQW
jgi:hypothetical protein